jgi:hypothetical protein
VTARSTHLASPSASSSRTTRLSSSKSMPWKSASERWARETRRCVGASTHLRPSCRRPWPARERWSRCPPAHGRAPAGREGRPVVRGRRTKRCRSLAHSAGRRQCTRQRVCSRSVHSTRPGRVRSGWAATPAQTRTLLRQRGQEQASRLEAQLACAAREARAPQQRPSGARLGAGAVLLPSIKARRRSLTRARIVAKSQKHERKY